jgi:pimeloyl-ACP methyl ester carboxylesterase
LTGFILVALPRLGHAAEAERVKFDTADQVEIRGTFYPSDRGKSAPCVLCLHAVGGNSQQEGWDELAKRLQKEGYAVLTFDFRGHGDSTTVGPNFWNQFPANRTIKGYQPYKPKETISYKDFTTPLNYAYIVNDIAAAKRFLDRRNDAGDCNSATTVVIGAESGAALGALWIAYEWHHRRMPVAGIPILATPNRNEMEGQDIACATWLSMSPTFSSGTRKWTIWADGWLRSPVREKVPMYFLYGQQDTRAANFARHLVDNVLRAPSDKHLKLTGMMHIKDTKLAGAELLGKPSLDTESLIIKYLDQVLKDRSTNPWTKKEIDRTFLLRIPVEQYLR